jgi:hydrogenase expression/formation protein HypD
VTGFEAVDILDGVLAAVEQLESGRHEVENRYRRVVRREGNPSAREAVNRVFQRCSREWRGIGLIETSGLQLRSEFHQFDAARRFPFGGGDKVRGGDGDCIAGDVLCGRRRPIDCPHLGTSCTPEHPLGAPMVSSEGACAAYHLYARAL